jgi:FkbM family methyltransferase
MNPQHLQQIQDAFQQVSRGMGSLNASLGSLRKRVYALDARARLDDAGRTARYPVEFRSQFGEDCILWDLFAGQLDGYFIEVGAFDGYDYSVTYALECVGWNGLLIEGIPQRAQACEERRRHSTVRNNALSKRGATGYAEFTVVEDHFGGMLSYLTTDEAHKKAIAVNKQQSAKVSVPLTWMDELLKDDVNLAARGGVVDAAVIDVEGGEIDVLEGFDLDKYKPKVMLLEDNTMREDSALGRYMKPKPYTFAGWLEVNRIYIRNDLAEWAKRLRA